MTKKTIYLTVLCATAYLASGVQAQNISTRQLSSQDVRANKIQGSAVLSSSGQSLGTLADVTVNYASGRIDLGLISLNSSAGGASGQLVPVPWSLLRASNLGATPQAASRQPLAFVFTGDAVKLRGAPSFSQNNWPNVNQPRWRQSVYSYYGVTPSVYRGAESSGGSDADSDNAPGVVTPSNPPR